jgi:hypothetical protein
VRVEDGLGMAVLLGNATGVGVGLTEGVGVGVLNFGAIYKVQFRCPFFFVHRYFFFREIVVDPNFLQTVPLIDGVAPKTG